MESEVPPATTEISLSSESMGDNSIINGNSDKNGASANLGGQTFFNSSNSSSVGSRLAGDDSIGSRLAGDSTGNRLSTNEKESPVYNPSTNVTGGGGIGVTRSASMKSQMGFGSTSKPAPANKMTLQEFGQFSAVKAESFKLWSVKAYKCTKQLLSEKMGRGTRTVDLELEARIEVLRDTKQKYENIVALMKVFADHFTMMCQTQKVLGEAFGELAGKSQDLQEEFQFNGETQFVLSKNGESLLAAVNFFISGMHTLCSKTMDDTLTTVKRYENSRVEYDAYRVELENLKLAPRTETNLNKQAQAQLNFSKHKDIYERLRSDVGVKLQFLDENRVKVMQKQLLGFHNAIVAYFAGNQQQLVATLKQFNIKLGTDTSRPSWLEKNGADP